MGGSRGSTRLLRPRALALLALAALALAFALGRVSAPTAAPSVGPAPTALAPSRQGAVTAYLAQQAALADPSLWRAPQAQRERRLGEMIDSVALRRSVEASIRTATYAATPLGRALRAGRPVLVRSAPLGYRVVSYSPQRAVLETWVCSLIGGRGISLDLRLARYRGEERWVNAGWRLARIETVDDSRAVRFRGAIELSGELAGALARFGRLRSEP